MPVSRIRPSSWMLTDGNSAIGTDNIVKKAGGYYKVHPNGTQELIHTLKTLGDAQASISSITNQADGIYTPSETLSFTVTFSEAVTVVTTGGTPSLKVYTEAGNFYDLPYASGSGTTALVFSGALDDPMSITNGELKLYTEIILNGGAIKDAGEQPANLLYPSAYTQPTITMATSRIVSITNQADGTYSSPETLSFSVTFSEAVTVVTTSGTPSLLVYTEAGNYYNLPYTSGTGTTTLVFSGALDAPRGIADGTLNLYTEIILNGGTIKDTGEQPANLLYPSDYVQPTITMATSYITSVTNPADGEYANTGALTFTVVFDSAVTKSGTDTLYIEVEDSESTTIQIPYASGSGTTTLVFTGPATGAADGALTVSTSIAFGTGALLSDAAANPAHPQFNVDYVQPAIVIATA